MRLNDQIKLVRKNMKKNKLRVFMTILATTMGCAFLIVLASIGFGVQKSVTEEITSYQLLTEIRVHSKTEGDTHRNNIEEDIAQLENTENVSAVVRRNYIQGAFEAEVDDYSGNIQIMITNMAEETKANFSLEAGRMPLQYNEVIVGYHFAKNLLTAEQQTQFQESMENGETPVDFEGYTGDLLNQTIKVTEMQDSDTAPIDLEFVIVGISKEPTRDWMEDRKIYVSDVFSEDFAAVTPEPEYDDEMLYHDLLVYVDSVQNVQLVTDALKEDGFMVYSISEELESMNLFFNALKVGLIFVGTVAVLIASIGIFNTMTMAVTERTQEIGIMKAIGAEPGVIRKIFLVESAFIGVIGSILGVLISYGISWAANFIIPLILESVTESSGPIEFTFSYIPLTLVIISCTISIGVAILSGLRPAVKATNINVLQALRREL